MKLKLFDYAREISKFTAILCVLLSFVSHPAFAAPAPPSLQDEQFNRWMTYYYLDKDASKVKEYLDWLQTSQTLEKNNGASQPIAAFLSVIFADNKTQLQSWLVGNSFTGKTKKTIEFALWLSGNGNLIPSLFKETPDFVNFPPKSLLKLEIKRPGDLDMMWGAFLASGNDQYVKKVVDVLDDNTPLSSDKTLDMAMRRAADWALGINMMQHELVNRLIRKEIATRSGGVKNKLESIVAMNEKSAKPPPNRDGDFSAMMLVTDESALKEYEKPSHVVMNFKEASKAKRGDTLAVKIVFSGMELTNELMCDVTYDLKVIDPDGNLYDNSDWKNIEALKIKTPMRFRVFDNRAFMKIRFEPNDQLGKYQFIATVYDNIGKKTIPLKNEIELNE